MKLLKRPAGPEQLEKFRGGRDEWSAVDLEDIWPYLIQMQGSFCAYCECSLERKHVEHFRTRRRFNNLTFDWNNLFGSCGDTRIKGGWDRCGIYKDNGAGEYEVDLLVKPDEDIPDEYLLFLTTGRVVPAKGLNGQKLLKAQETIRVFNLNGDPSLVGRRKTTLSYVLDEVKTLYDAYDELDEEFWHEMLDDALQAISHTEFSTALRHVWLHNREY
ncbi:TIGR02646 family protein [Klebsiella quasipneumoniae]|uniref:retron Ec78 anti-phage system effector HNH endonuclease PtuB n=1 Tax=Klebsiella pneumoniae complex TaxID=3390273 RepID=UPI001648FAEE|nr:MULTISPECIES: retron Ec78 anti-phage system effector HNH endonuclease PtuB [Klebsiella]HBR2024960.1 TIGR02646 family protein [Klebsiella variicola]MBC4288539.1 TIGR02646 family protein [Klebsiella quasipneumoniae]MCD7074575.1 TIGR02646 family protein [Klebsiella quasipneumoniae subsp. similipneumoniae]MCD7105908.1 TIGR02646 family protein [Klebsiella quasipneumoniae subsp. similipneumoniae]MDE4668639.1 TIGR02646 family protein [Klebsiella pneumoniae]